MPLHSQQPGAEPDPPIGSTGGVRNDLVQLGLLALVVRLTVAVFWNPAPTGDAVDYLRLAEGLARGDGFVGTNGVPTSWRPPLYPAFLAPFVGLWSGAGAAGYSAVRVVQALIATGSVLLVYLVGSLWFGRTVGRISGVLTATSFAHIAAVSRMLSETLFVFFFLAGIALLSVVWRGRAKQFPGNGRPATDVWLHLAAGLCLGLATLVRGVLLPFPFALAATMVGVSLLSRGHFPVRRGLTSALVLLTGFGLALGPWTLRNYRVHEVLVPLATQGGATLYAGNHPQDGYILGRMADDSRTEAALAMSEVEASRFLTDKTVADWLAHPERLPGLVTLKLLYFWAPADWEVLPGSGAFNLTYAFIVLWAAIALGGAALPASERRTRTLAADGLQLDSGPGLRFAWVVWMPIVYFLAVAIVFYGSPRLRMPVEPLLAVLAAVGLSRVVEAVGLRRGMLTAGCAALLIVGIGGMWESVEAVVRSTVIGGGAG